MDEEWRDLRKPDPQQGLWVTACSGASKRNKDVFERQTRAGQQQYHTPRRTLSALHPSKGPRVTCTVRAKSETHVQTRETGHYLGCDKSPQPPKHRWATQSIRRRRESWELCSHDFTYDEVEFLRAVCLSISQVFLGVPANYINYLARQRNAQ